MANHDQEEKKKEKERKDEEAKDKADSLLFGGLEDEFDL